MTLTTLEQTLLNNARKHQKELAAFYAKSQTGQLNEEEHTDYSLCCGGFTELISLALYNSGLSPEASVQMKQIEQDDIEALKLYRPVEDSKSGNKDFLKPVRAIEPANPTTKN